MKEREWGEGGGDETDINSKRVLALVILVFSAAQFSLCVSVLSVSI